MLRLRSQEDAPCISQVWGFPGPDPCLQAPWGHQRNSFSYLCRTEVAGFLKTLRDYPQSPEATHRALPQGSPNLVTEISSQQNGLTYHRSGKDVPSVASHSSSPLTHTPGEGLIHQEMGSKSHPRVSLPHLLTSISWNPTSLGRVVVCHRQR